MLQALQLAQRLAISLPALLSSSACEMVQRLAKSLYLLTQDVHDNRILEVKKQFETDPVPDVFKALNARVCSFCEDTVPFLGDWFQCKVGCNFFSLLPALFGATRRLVLFLPEYE